MQSRDLDAKQFKWLLGVSHSLMTTLEFKAVARLSCTSLMELFPYDRVSLWLKPNDGTQLRSLISVYQDGSESHYEDERLTDWLASLMSQRQALLMNREDLGEHRPHLKQLNKVDADIAHVFPLYINDDPVGILYGDIRHADENPMTPTFKEMTKYLCGLIGASLHSARRYEHSTHDPLTGLPNGSYLQLELGQLLEAEPLENWKTGGLIILDLDDFKRVNQAGGTSVGDRALEEIADTLRDIVDSDGLLIRYGSDKFAIFMEPNDAISVQLRLRDVAERARASIAAKTFHGVSISACIGGVSFEAFEETATALDLIAAADDARRRARKRGKGEVEIN